MAIRLLRRLKSKPYCCWAKSRDKKVNLKRNMSIQTVISEIKETLPSEVTLVAISKTYPEERIMEAYNAGQRVFGENRPQEMSRKFENLPKDISWQMIGHLQSNKVRSIISFVDLIHSVDSRKILETINSEAKRAGRVVDVLLEVFVAQEQSKHGLEAFEILDLMSEGIFEQLENVRLRGLMCIGTFTDDLTLTRREFCSVKSLFDKIAGSYMSDKAYFDTLSMGMSGDYQLAVECGSTMVRVGSMIFGARDYSL